MNSKPRFGVCARGIVGEMAVRLFRDNSEQLVCLFITEDDFWKWNDKILREAEKCNLDTNRIYTYKDEDSFNDILRNTKCDCLILAYWSNIIRLETFELLSWGCINLHTSYLPYNKGKHPHCWAIMDGTPYGATIMKIDENLDTGNILYQKQVNFSWEDNAKTLYFKAIKTIWELLCENKPSILNLSMKEIQQDGIGTFHYGRELEEIATINMSEKYVAKDLINILRAKSFSGFPAARFVENGTEYEITVDIKERRNSTKVDYEGLAISMDVWPIE